jgi:hypothetical protein
MASIVNYEQDHNSFMAETVAMFAHEATGQRRVVFSDGQREEGDEPYYNHPLRVAGGVRNFFNTDAWKRMSFVNHDKDKLRWAAINAAYLHDVIEDTKIKREYIEEYFGLTTMTIVMGCTSVLSDRKDLPRAVKKAVNRCRLFNASHAHAYAPFIYLIKTEDHSDNWFNNNRDDLNNRSRTLTEIIINVATYICALQRGPNDSVLLQAYLNGVIDGIMSDAAQLGIHPTSVATHYVSMMDLWAKAGKDDNFTYNLKSLPHDWAKSMADYMPVVDLIKDNLEHLFSRYVRIFNHKNEAG